MAIKSLILQSIEEVLKKKLSSELPATSSNLITLEAWLSRAAQYIKELEADASSALKVEHLKRVNYLEGLVKENNERYIKKENAYMKIMADLRQRLDETYKRLPLEERLKSEFVCASCDLDWDTEFLVFTDAKGNKFCWDCMNKGTERAGEDTGQEITIESTPKSSSIKLRPCEFCGLSDINELYKIHITNAPDGRNSKDIIRVCENCMLTKAKKDRSIQYCPRVTAARDDYDLPEYDCNCLPKEKYQTNY